MKSKHTKDFYNYTTLFHTVSDVCGFDSDNCGFTNSVDHDGRWIRERGTKNEEDHTYGTENGE